MQLLVRVSGFFFLIVLQASLLAEEDRAYYDSNEYSHSVLDQTYISSNNPQHTYELYLAEIKNSEFTQEQLLEIALDPKNRSVRDVFYDSRLPKSLRYRMAVFSKPEGRQKGFRPVFSTRDGRFTFSIAFSESYEGGRSIESIEARHPDLLPRFHLIAMPEKPGERPVHRANPESCLQCHLGKERDPKSRGTLRWNIDSYFVWKDMIGPIDDDYSNRLKRDNILSAATIDSFYADGLLLDDAKSREETKRFLKESRESYLSGMKGLEERFSLEGISTAPESGARPNAVLSLRLQFRNMERLAGMILRKESYPLLRPIVYAILTNPGDPELLANLAEDLGSLGFRDLNEKYEKNEEYMEAREILQSWVGLYFRPEHHRVMFALEANDNRAYEQSRRRLHDVISAVAHLVLLDLELGGDITSRGLELRNWPMTRSEESITLTSPFFGGLYEPLRFLGNVLAAHDPVIRDWYQKGELSRDHLEKMWPVAIKELRKRQAQDPGP